MDIQRCEYIPWIYIYMYVNIFLVNIIIRSAFTIGFDFSYWKNYSMLEVWKLFPREIWCVGCETSPFASRHFNVISEWTWIWFYCCLVLTAEAGYRRKGAESWLALSDHSETWTLARNILQMEALLSLQHLGFPGDFDGSRGVSKALFPIPASSWTL